MRGSARIDVLNFFFLFESQEGETEHDGDDEDYSETEESTDELGANAATLYVPQNMEGNMCVD
jgi:hypothetical protein